MGAMDFTVEQRFPASADAALALYCDPDFYAGVGATERLAPPEVLDRAEGDGTVTLRIRYRFTADLPSAAKRFVEPDKLTWVERTVFDLATATARSELLADHYGSLLTASARSAFHDRDGASVRQVDGRLQVKVPLFGGRVERAIVDGLREYLHDEQAVAAARLAS